jgi:transposase-like protein
MTRSRIPAIVSAPQKHYIQANLVIRHGQVKQRLRPMLGFKSFQTAAVVIGGIELAEKINKGQFKLGKLGGRAATMPEIWRAALAA